MDAPLVVPPQGHGSIQGPVDADGGATPSDGEQGKQSFVAITAAAGGSPEARDAANAILGVLAGLPTWPQGHRDHFERVLKGGDDGWKRMAQDLVKWHSSTNKERQGERKLRGASEQLQDAALTLLYDSDFKAMALSHYGPGEPPAVPDQWAGLPEYMRKGPWSPLAYPAFAAFLGVLVWQAKPAFEELHLLTAAAGTAHLEAVAATAAGWHGWIPVVCRAAGGLYMIGIIIKQVTGMGKWVVITYTIQSYSVLLVRLLLAALGRFWPWAAWGAELLRFPALVQNSVVVLVWWLVLVPFITKLKPPAERGGFLRFNLSFDLVNIHFLNLPAAGLDYLAAPRPPHLVDGWVVAALLFCYFVFYVLVLDRHQIHLYIIFTPRTHFCVLAYAGMAGLLYGLLKGWGWAGSWSMFCGGGGSMSGSGLL
jgi:hypothetical protein